MKVYVVTIQLQDDHSELLSIHRTDSGAIAFINNYIATEKPYEGSVWHVSDPQNKALLGLPCEWHHVHHTTLPLYPLSFLYYEECELQD